MDNLIFVLGRTAIFFTICFHVMKSIRKYFVQQYNKRFTGKQKVKKNKKQKQNNVTKPTKKKCKKYRKSIIEIFLKKKKIKKNYGNIRNENVLKNI